MSNAMRMNRRAVLGTGLALIAVPGLAMGREGFVIDWQGGEETPAVKASLEAQIALVEALPVSAEAMAFFRSQVITVDRAEGTRTRAGPRGIFFQRRAMPPGDPVLLHELIHRWQLVRMAEGIRNPDVRRFYEAAKAARLYPPRAYVLSNAFEFFAMNASVVLYGRASRPPFERANVKRKQPDLYAYIVREFGLQEAGTSSTTSSNDSKRG
ncbi:hypothetical protein P1X14_05305 [Sphingomonas sp. AOB5]|uniref:hypothetical protein n=1 Tax=Sphingomonas sp. AOB5 TaxID=3034017 RepID=UPI0023F82CA9|nr:hypothetical protein [Sphingomonas sp. AOB5]MDF7774656.1 hypothetical protein [Sphingomonas sp. AOB5]